MADDNKPLKYMRYAIGEILLVVIGILIALQINTWNEERKERKEEKVLLLELRREVVSNIRILDFHMVHLDEIMHNTNLYFNFFLSEESFYNVDSLFAMLNLMGYEEDYRPLTNVLSSTVASERMVLIKDQELRFYLNSLEGAISHVENINENRQLQKYERLEPVMSKYFNDRNLRLYTQGKIDDKLLIYSKSFREFFRDFEIQNTVGAIWGFTNFERETSDWVYGILNDVLELLDENLTKYEDITFKTNYSGINVRGSAAKGWNEPIALKPVNKDKSRWEGLIELHQGLILFGNRNSWTITWTGKTFPKGELLEPSSAYNGAINAESGKYKVIVDFSNNTYEFIKQDD